MANEPCVNRSIVPSEPRTENMFMDEGIGGMGTSKIFGEWAVGQRPTSVEKFDSSTDHKSKSRFQRAVTAFAIEWV